MYEKILVPLDGSKVAETAIPYAEEFAIMLGGQVIFVSVSEPVPIDTERVYQSYLERIEEQVQHQLKDRRPDKIAVIQGKVLIGKPAEEIIRFADEAEVGLIVMTSRGSSTGGPWLLGNIAAKVLRGTRRPVLLIRAPVIEAAARRRNLVKKILVPLDGSHLGEAAVPYAETLAMALGAELILFHIIEPMPMLTGYESFSVPAQESESVKADSTTYLENVAKSAKDKGLIVSTLVDFGSPADNIIDYAKAHSIDLIAMSTRGRTGIRRWAFGSVTDKVLHAGDTPVMVVRPSEG
jgi:nucleotide-binding universal stress UspA family protein